MKLKNAEVIVEDLQERGFEADVHEGYSGRGMFGEETAGVDCDCDPIQVGISMGRLGIDDSTRQDSMGKGVIVY